jgi:beta-glucosidase
VRRINGVPACANKRLLTDIARNEWGFKGYVVSDAWAISNIRDMHKYTKTIEETVAASIGAGCNLELASKFYFETMGAVNQSLLTKEQVVLITQYSSLYNRAEFVFLFNGFY